MIRTEGSGIVLFKNKIQELTHQLMLRMHIVRPCQYGVIRAHRDVRKRGNVHGYDCDVIWLCSSSYIETPQLAGLKLRINIWSDRWDVRCCLFW